MTRTYVTARLFKGTEIKSFGGCELYTQEDKYPMIEYTWGAEDEEDLAALITWLREELDAPYSVH